MKFDAAKLKNWVAGKEVYLPGLGELFSKTKSDILIIGASVFELYEIQGWIVPFKRKTGDIDLSIGIISDDSLYAEGKDILLSLKYTVDGHHPYRYHPPKMHPGGYTYVDLLAHPADEKTRPEIASHAMGAGPGFSFRGFHFAQEKAYKLQKNVSFPNPFGLISLKQESYLDEPVRRSKDFADIVELASGLVETGTHFEIDKLWSKISQKPEAKRIKEMFRMILAEDTRWDLEEIRNDLHGRNFDDTFIDETLPQRLKDFSEILE